MSKRNYFSHQIALQASSNFSYFFRNWTNVCLFPFDNTKCQGRFRFSSVLQPRSFWCRMFFLNDLHIIIKQNRLNSVCFKLYFFIHKFSHTLSHQCGFLPHANFQYRMASIFSWINWEENIFAENSLQVRNYQNSQCEWSTKLSICSYFIFLCCQTLHISEPTVTFVQKLRLWGVYVNIWFWNCKFLAESLFSTSKENLQSKSINRQHKFQWFSLGNHSTKAKP